MLRAARESRRIQHPHATYSSGSLTCNICRIAIKTDSVWDPHIRSAQHMERLKEVNKGQVGLASRKRKADDTTKLQEEVKRARVEDSETESVLQNPSQIGVDSRPNEPVEQQSVDEDEWKAFERDMQRADERRAKAGAPDGIITAAPRTAEDLAAEAREFQSQQRSIREAEDEAEQDEAADRVQDEFEEMERLQTRMRLLRERGEALKRKIGSQLADGASRDVAIPPVEETPRSDGESGEESDDSADDDEWQGLTIRR